MQGPDVMTFFPLLQSNCRRSVPTESSRLSAPPQPASHTARYHTGTYQLSAWKKWWKQQIALAHSPGCLFSHVLICQFSVTSLSLEAVIDNNWREGAKLVAAGICCLLKAVEHLPRVEKSPRGVLIPLSCPEEILQLWKETWNRPLQYLLTLYIGVMHEHLYHPQWLSPINESHIQQKQCPGIDVPYFHMHCSVVWVPVCPVKRIKLTAVHFMARVFMCRIVD